MIGLFGAGAMGSALGAGWQAGGTQVVTCVAGRSERTRALVSAAGLDVVESLDELVRCEVVVSVVPPGSAVDVARSVAAAASRVGAAPLVADLNAIAPPTVHAVAAALGDLDLIDGSLSGGPPRAGRPTRVYLSGPHAESFPANPWLDAVVLGGELGTASALKMCTASVYKGTKAVIMQAMLTAQRHGVLDEFLADTAREWPDDVPAWHTDIALAATKAARYVDEMEEIARTQADAGLPAELFEGMAAAYARAARTELGRRPPESVDGTATPDEVLAALDDTR